MLSFSGRNPIGVAGAESGRHRRQLQQLRVFESRERRLQHQRQPAGREQHLRRRRDGDPHPVQRRDRRRPERRRHPGSAGADRRLPAGVRPGERRADPVHHQERQQPLLPAARRSSIATTRSRRTPGARNRSTERASRTPARRRSTTSSTGIRSAGRSRRTRCSSSPPRSGSTSSRSQTNTATVPTALMRNGELQRAAVADQRVLQRARRSSGTRPRGSRSRQRHSPRAPGRERDRVHEAVSGSRRPGSSRARRTRSSTATTRRTSGRTTSGSTTG